MNRMVFRLKVCEETYQDERRIKTNIMRMEPVDYKKECKVADGERAGEACIGGRGGGFMASLVRV